MDHQAFAQLLGNYGEFVGAIAVVATLLFLVVQVRQNTKALRSTIYSSWATSAAISHQILIDHSDVFAKIRDSGKTRLEELSTAESIVIRSTFVHMMNTFETAFLHHLDGAIDDGILEAKQRNMVRALSAEPLYRESWEMRQADGGPWDRRFVDFVNHNVLPALDPSLPPRV